MNSANTKLNLPELHLLTNSEIMPSVTFKVKFFFEGVKVEIRDRTRLKNFIELIFKKEKKRLKLINYIFCDDNLLLRINKKYLNHNFLTDIITFDLSGKGNSIIADVYISVERVKENAVEQKESFKKELNRVILHGALHLCDYKDKTLSEKKKMRSKENYYLEELDNSFT